MNTITLRPLALQDNPAIAQVIREVSAEHGLTADKGYGVADPCLDDLFHVYNQAGAHYWVIEQHGAIVGGGGYAPLAQHDTICELQKMYFSPQIRRLGFAKKIIALTCEHAKAHGYTQVYLETTQDLGAALNLYEQQGFEHLTKPLGNTGHDACEIAMLKTL